MKKILAVLLATSSVAVFADTFQDFNNNLYAQYTYANTTFTGPEASTSLNGFGIGGTFQTKNDIWANASINKFKIMQGGSVQTVTNVKAGYAFQFFGDDDSGFQVVPYASFNSVSEQSSYSWGVGVLPQYRLMGSLMAGLGIGLQGMNGRNDKGNNTTIMAFNVNPEVQYDIAKTIMLSVGYNYNTTFNGNASEATNSITLKGGYLF